MSDSGFIDIDTGVNAGKIRKPADTELAGARGHGAGVDDYPSKELRAELARINTAFSTCTRRRKLRELRARLAAGEARAQGA